MAQEREYLTAISIDAGIITLIQPNGQIGYYRQRGIQTLSNQAKQAQISSGKLNQMWENIPELPRNWSISFEDTEIMGRALATFPEVSRLSTLARNKAKNTKTKSIKAKT